MNKTIKIIVIGILSLISLFALIYLLFFTSQIYDIFDVLGKLMPLPLFILSLYFLINLIKDKEFEKKKKYGLNLFILGIIISFFVVILSLLKDLLFPPIGFGGLAALLFAAIGSIFSFILGIIGLIIDYIKSK